MAGNPTNPVSATVSAGLGEPGAGEPFVSIDVPRDVALSEADRLWALLRDPSDVWDRSGRRWRVRTTRERRVANLPEVQLTYSPEDGSALLTAFGLWLVDWPLLETSERPEGGYGPSLGRVGKCK